MNVKHVVKAVQTWTDEEWALAAQLRKLSAAPAAPKRRPYKRRTKAERKAAEEAKPRRARTADKGNGGELAFPKPTGRKRGRPRKVQTMIPPPAPEAQIEA